MTLAVLFVWTPAKRSCGVAAKQEFPEELPTLLQVIRHLRIACPNNSFQDSGDVFSSLPAYKLCTASTRLLSIMYHVATLHKCLQLQHIGSLVHPAPMVA